MKRAEVVHGTHGVQVSWAQRLFSPLQCFFEQRAGIIQFARVMPDASEVVDTFKSGLMPVA